MLCDSPNYHQTISNSASSSSSSPNTNTITSNNNSKTTNTTTTSSDSEPPPTGTTSNSNSNNNNTSSTTSGSVFAERKSVLNNVNTVAGNEHGLDDENDDSCNVGSGSGGQLIRPTYYRKSTSSISSAHSRTHPNIHHHPAIHPHHHQRHQRALSNTSNETGHNNNVPTATTEVLVSNPLQPTLRRMRENSTSSMLSVPSTTTGSSSSSGNNRSAMIMTDQQQQQHEEFPTSVVENFNDSGGDSGTGEGGVNDSDTIEEFKITENQIIQMQELINKLNYEIFKNPQNYTRPPSEYLEVYNTFTATLHSLQKKKETLDQAIKQSHEHSNNCVAPDSNSNHQFGGSNNNDDCERVDIRPQMMCTTPPNSTLSCSPSKQTLNETTTTPESDLFYSKKPPLPKNLPKFKLDHPTTLNTTSSNNSSNFATNNKQNQLKTPQTPTQPISYRSSPIGATTPIISASSSPATTPTFSNHYQLQSGGGGDSPPLNYSYQQQQQQQQQPYLSPSSSSISLPSTVVNNQQQQQQLINQQQQQLLNSAYSIAHNRSFGDITEAIIAPILNGATTPNASISPSASSAATTPTYNSLPSSFLRVYIGTSTAVVEKKAIMLKDALSSKLKSRNLEVEKCIAFIKDSNVKIDWDFEVNKLNYDHIVVAEYGDEIRHSFEKKTFTLRSCDSCKKRFLLNVYACSKCDYVMCQRNECRARSERIVCAPRRISQEPSSIKSNSSSLSKPVDYDIFGRPESPVRDTSINISQQILPVNQLKVSIPSRDRSRSETELNMFINPKLTNETSRPVPKSPSTLAKSTNKNNSIYGTIPRSQLMIKPSNSDMINNTIDDISGSVNEESGSVISSICAKSLTNEKLIKPDAKQLSKVMKQSKPSRRDSFNSWEIPFSQIKIDMNKKVGSGSFGIVHQGRDFYHGTVAIKFLNVQNPTPTQAHAFRNEVAILKSTRHDYILLFIGCILKPYLAIVTEWCPGSSLYRHLHVEEEHWDMFQLIEIAKQTATGMEYLHARDILHRDLKSNNIFLIPKETNSIQTYRHFGNGANSKNRLNEFLSGGSQREAEPKWSVKIGDFGLATVKSAWTQSSAKTNQPTGSILWMAPEVITQKVADPYTQKSDVYSYAVVLYELLTGHLPYQHKEQNMILFLVGSGRLKLNPDDSRDDTPKELKDLIVECSQYDRNKRYDFVEINERLRKIKYIKSKLSKLQRAQSVPNVSFTQEHSQGMGLNIYEDENYPGTPHPDMMSKLNSPLQFPSDFNDPPPINSNISGFFSKSSNNSNMISTDTSQLITNL